MKEFLSLFTINFFAEMGDKTQLLAMMLAAQSGFLPVFAGVVAATILLQLIAVALGVVLGELINNRALLLLISAAVFAYFGIKTILENDEDEEESVKKASHPAITAFTLFFVAELGDKTQLATLAKASTSTAPLLTFAGAVIGMITANALGMLVGSQIKKYFSEKQINLAGGIIFLVFAVLSAYGAVKSIL